MFNGLGKLGENNCKSENTETTALKIIEIEGEKFQHKPVGNESRGEVQNGDLALNGWISRNKFGKILSYEGGRNDDPTKFENWKEIETI